MTTFMANSGYDQPAAGHSQNDPHMKGTEMVDMTGVVTHDLPQQKPFDWCILSVLGYLCFAPTGFCAMYYAMRVNHGHDFNIEGQKINTASTKAKVLTILSIVLGSVILLTIIITIVVLITAENDYERIYYNNYSGK